MFKEMTVKTAQTKNDYYNYKFHNIFSIIYQAVMNIINPLCIIMKSQKLKFKYYYFNYLFKVIR